ncbi:MAG: chorismate-binding protein [Rhodoferax sp.]
MRAFVDFPQQPGAPDAHEAQAPRWRAAFADPVAVREAWTLDEVLPLLEQVQRWAAQGLWCVGEIAYEAASAFDTALHTQPAQSGWPLARFAAYAQCQPWPQQTMERAAVELQTIEGAAVELQGWQWDTEEAAYALAVARARQAMADGECYQINLTQRLSSAVQGDAAALQAWFARLCQAQQGAYHLALDWGAQQVLSVSPELFFDWAPDANGGVLRCQPMKGTAPRGIDAAQDAQARAALQGSAKERAENVMIVDLLRNDMGRVAVPGTVRVQELFGVHAWPTVWQMTSTIAARTRAGVGLVELLRALFPCGSVTGAPKASAMGHIAALERSARGVYCGALGVVRPGGAATFTVPIRTLALQRDEDPGSSHWQARYGVGSAITFYAQAQSEWQELGAKARVLERAASGFELLETLLLHDGAYTLLDAHVARMASSAAYFGHRFDAPVVQAALDAVAARHPQGRWRVRLLSSAQGQAQAQAFALEPSPDTVLCKLALQALATDGALQEFVQHKTTRRAHYDRLLVAEPGVFDTLLYNARGELTEFTRGNLALRIDGQWLTPALHCGVLPGTYRAELLAQGRLQEAVLTRADLEQAQEAAFFNSVRGWLAVRWQGR